ncbi:MAG: hypothetical protein PSV13_02210 [Lacunisphaera sp.]|nr:hypothetical protein [Lacunisphaera sp.]
MRLKIKWNDDRVRGATAAILLIGRDRLARGLTENLVRESLAEYRADPAGYKERKRTWADAKEPGPLKKPAAVAQYRNLVSAVAALLQKMAENKRQSNSLLELDNYLVASLEKTGPRGGIALRPSDGRTM